MFCHLLPLRSACYSLLILLSAGLPLHAEETLVAGDSARVSAPDPTLGVTTIEGNRMEIYLGREMRVFGDAEIQRDGDYVKGDRIDVDTLNDELHATGNVHVKQGSTLAEGPELRLKMQDRVGEMQYPVFHLKSGAQNARGDASSILFEGPTKETLKKARYTTCEDGNDDWFLNAGELELDHYAETATATHASMEFKGVPFVYTPWMYFPLNKERKSGFMMPLFGTTTKSGLELSIPYYWNIAPNRDATLTPHYMSKRGVQLQSEYRYLSENYSGTANVDVLPNDDLTNSTRYYVNFAHSHDFHNGWTGNIQYEKVSDNQYFIDMSNRITSTSRANLPQQVSAKYDATNWHFSALLQQYQTIDNISYTYQRLPQLTLSGSEELAEVSSHETEFGTLNANLYSEFVRFDLNDRAPVAVTGNRYTIYPSLSLPMSQSYGYVTPKIGVHYTKYSLSNTGGAFDSGTRALPIFSVDSGLYFDRDMHVVKNHYTQTIEPRLFYVYVPHHDQSRIPNFDTGLSDLNLATIFSENQFSGGDRVNDANQVTLAVTSRLIDQKTGAQRLSATLGERFYFSDQKVILPGGTPRTSAQSDILTALSAQLANGWNADVAWQFDTNQSRTVKSNIGARYQPEAGKVLNLGYRFTKDSLEQVDFSAQWPLGGRWYGLGRLNYSLRDHPPTDVSGPIEYLAGVEYDAGCWQGRAIFQRLATATATATADSAYAFFFQLELGGFSKIGSNPLEIIKRNIPGYISSSEISNATR